MGKREPFSTINGMQTDTATMENSMRFLKKVKL